MRIFSRNCEDRTPSFPDVAEIVRAAAVGTQLHVWMNHTLYSSTICKLICRGSPCPNFAWE